MCAAHERRVVTEQSWAKAGHPYGHEWATLHHFWSHVAANAFTQQRMWRNEKVMLFFKRDSSSENIMSDVWNILKLKNTF